jgi:DNA primase
MARYSPDAKEQVRDAVDMVDLVSSRTELRRAGANRFEGLCPFHEERTPSFGVDPVKKVYHCFGCGAGGDVFTFVQEIEGLDFVGALEYLADRYGIELEREEEDPRAAERRHKRERLYELLERATSFYERYLWESDEAAGAREYLAGRGLEEDTLREFRVGYAPSAYDRMLGAARQAGFTNRESFESGLAQRAKGEGRLYDRFRRRITFPLTDHRGRVLGFGARQMGEADRGPKYLNTPEGELYHKGRQLFGLALARPEAARIGEVVLVEGYTDVLALHQAGLSNTVGLMGTALTEEQVGELARLVGGSDAARVTLALDADASGQQAMIRAAAVAAGRKLDLRVAPLPEGRDPADLVTDEGADAVRARIAASVPFEEFSFERVLAGADLGSASGRDRALADLGRVLAAVAPGVQHDELVRRAADRLGLSERLVAQLAAAGPEGNGNGSARSASAPGTALDKREQTERTFLSLCIALPDVGAKALDGIDLDRHLTGALTRRAAAHLREHLEAPTDGIASDDGELLSLMAELSLRAAREPAGPATLEVEALQLEKDRLEREIAAGRSARSLDVADLAMQRADVVTRLEDALERASMERAG